MVNKGRAHGLVALAIRDGILIRPAHCERCGAERPVAHHEDYDYPLDVVWLCRLCHSKRHVEMGTVYSRPRVKTRLLSIKVKDETAKALYAMAVEMSRNPGQQLDVIIADYLARYASPVSDTSAVANGQEVKR